MSADEVIQRVGLALHRLREAQGMDLPHFEKKSGLSAERIVHIETGKYGGLSLAGLCAYADALGVSLDLLADSVAELFEQTAEILEENRRKKRE